MSRGDVYTLEQVRTYLARISFPTDKWPSIPQPEQRLEYLSQLLLYHQSRVPFENLSLHYSTKPEISLDKEDLYEKLVERCRGGYCMEQNHFFGTVLKTLEYEVIPTGGRVCLGGSVTGLSHSVNLVQIAGVVYVVDVGFGGTGPTRPLPLTHGLVLKWGATDGETRLLYQEPKTSFVQGLWTYQHRNSSSESWSPVYNFATTEFFPGDFEVMSYAVSNRRQSWFTQRILCTVLILDDEVGDIIGRLVLSDGKLTKRIQNSTELITECSDEDERLKALSEHFGIVLSSKEQEGIRGTVAELKTVPLL